MEAIEQVKKLIESGISPNAEYVAAAGLDCGWVKVWKVDGGYVVQYGDGDNTYTAFENDISLYEDELADWLEWQDLDPLDSIEQRANIRGADAIPVAVGDESGPFYILMTRYWYGPREISRFVSDGRGEPMEFETIKDAYEWLKHANSGIYHLAHGEYARPTYKVVTT
jgi:hypothetical protein